MELLAPIGNFESLNYALVNGANAVYFGVNKFNARNNIEGFTETDIEKVVNLCHLRNVKVYLAINILFKEEELSSALDLVYTANNYGVDAFIVQDLGLVNLIKENYPNIVLHASTQQAIHNLEGAIMLKELGFTRVVLAREVSLEEIEYIHKNCDIEIEFFVQGALCVSFSGNCYMSSYLADKSGNRGLCAQYCRHCYEMEKDNKALCEGFLLSAKDICMLDKLQEMHKAGVISLKIEGRARRPFYVGQVCNTYRKVLDNNFEYSKKDLEDLKLAFNREFTPGYFEGNEDIISNYSNHIGIRIGKLEKINIGKKFNEVYVASKRAVPAKSVLKFFDKEKEFATVSPYDIKKTKAGFMFTTTTKLKPNLNVNLINDAELENEFKQQSIKVPIEIEVEAFSNKPLKLTYEDLTEEFDILEKAKTKIFDKQSFETSFNKNEDFKVNVKLVTDGVFILNSKINNIRNIFLNKIKNKILNNYLNKNKIIKINNKINLNLFSRRKYNVNSFNFEIIYNLNDINKIKLNNYKIIIYSPDNYLKADILKFKELLNGKYFYLDLPNFCTSKEIDYFKKIVQEVGCGIVANNLSQLRFVTKKIGGSFLNVYNSFAINLLKDFGVTKFFIAERKEDELKLFKEDFDYAFREKVYMTFKFCPIKQVHKNKCESCIYSDEYSYILNGKKFKLKRKRALECVFYLTD